MSKLIWWIFYIDVSLLDGTSWNVFMIMTNSAKISYTYQYGTLCQTNITMENHNIFWKNSLFFYGHVQWHTKWSEGIWKVVKMSRRYAQFYGTQFGPSKWCHSLPGFNGGITEMRCSDVGRCIRLLRWKPGDTIKHSYSSDGPQMSCCFADFMCHVSSEPIIYHVWKKASMR